MVQRRLRVINQEHSLINLLAIIREKQSFSSEKKLLKGTHVSITKILIVKRKGILKEATENTNFITYGPHMIKYYTKMETTIKLKIFMIDIEFNVVVNVTIKWKGKIVLHLVLLSFFQIIWVG